MRSFFISLLLSVFLPGVLCAQASLMKDVRRPVFMENNSIWVDSLMDAMSLREQIGQLFMVAAYSNRAEDHVKELESMISDHGIGGLIFFQGGPERQIAMTNRLQGQSKIPLMIGMDAEWGVAMRLDSTIHYPYQMTLGAIRNDTMIHEMGREIGRQMKALGMHVNFAPVVDVNNNPDNPVINYRSFGEDPWRVSRKGVAYMSGLQRSGVLANAKHFPGHGDTDVDSHLGLPVILHDRARLDSIELFPFRQLAQRGLSSMMVAHLHIPAIDPTPGLPMTMSEKAVNGLLREEIGYEGLLFTDALNMKGIAAGRNPAELALEALIAGQDILLFPEDVAGTIKLIEEAVESGRIDASVIEEHCARILKSKAWLGLDKPVAILEESEAWSALDNDHAHRLNRILYERALTLAHHDGEILPLKQEQLSETAYLAIGGKLDNTFHQQLKAEGIAKAAACPARPDSRRRQQLAEIVQLYPRVVVGLHGMGRSPKDNFRLSTEAIELVYDLAQEHEVILSTFGNPYALSAFKGLDSLSAVLVTYEENEYTLGAAAKAILGTLEVDGRLPVSIDPDHPSGTGHTLAHLRLGEAIPEELGLSSLDLAEIDSIALEGIEAGAYPGCVVLVAKEGKVVYEKAFGHHTYEEKRPVNLSDVYDIASITKVAATAGSLIHLVEEGLVDIDGTLGEHLPDLPDSSLYRDLVLRDVLAHQAGLQPWIPFYTNTLKDGRLDPELYRPTAKDNYDVQVADGVYLHHGQQDSILTRILKTPLRKKNKGGTWEYKYSDLGYYFMKAIIEQQTGMGLEAYVDSVIYRPMGLDRIGYLPLERFDSDVIVPTEYDMYYRMQLLKGHVHDMGAAMQGGVGGHAGLFSNASDLAALMQMFMDGGTYGGTRLLNDSIIHEFTKCQYCTGERDENRRGVAFDKPNRHGDEGPTCNCISYESFGHSGFTGTLSWADPEEEVVYVFLSNRIYPSMANKKLQKMNIRTRVMEVIYMAIENGKTLEALHSGKDLGSLLPKDPPSVDEPITEHGAGSGG